MANTPNYNLKKVEYTEIADIPGHFNANFDTIDTVMKNNADAAVAAEDNAKSYASGLIGTLSNLLTTAKNNIVAAVNEIFGKVEDVEDELAAHKAENVSQKEVHGLRIEEGVWVPKLAGSVTAGEHTYSKQVGKYIREGNKVTIWFDIALSALDSNANGNARVVGIPFPTNSKNPGALTWTNISMPTGFTSMTGAVLYAAVQLYNVGDATPASAVNINSFKNNSSITGTVVYYIA